MRSANGPRLSARENTFGSCKPLAFAGPEINGLGSETETVAIVAQ